MSDEGSRQVEAYLEGLGDEQGQTLRAVRAAIQSIVPEASERLSYGLPAFFLDKPIAGYGAARKHCSYYPMSGSVIASLADELSAFATSKGAVRFPNDDPLPKSIIAKLLHARIAELT